MSTSSFLPALEIKTKFSYEMPVLPRRISDFNLLAFNSHTHPYSLVQFISDSKVVVPRFLARVFGDASSTKSCYRFLKPNFGTHGLHSSSRRSFSNGNLLPAGVQYGVWQQVLAITIVVVRESRQFPQSDYFYCYYAAQRKHYNYQFGFTSSPFIDPLASLQPCWFSFNLQQLCSSSFQRCTVADCNRGGL